MSKRLATSELNHDNWNDEEAPEDAGTFKKAAPDVIQTREIRTAKRRSMGTTDSPDGKKSAFAGHSFFKANSTPSSSPFAFLKNARENRSSSPALNGSPSSSGNLLFKNDSMTGMPKATEPASDKSKHPSQNSEEKSSDYYSRLKGLNESVSQWIKSHVDSNPLCILTPIFKDYERYLAEIETSNKDSGGIALNDKSVSDRGKVPMFGFGSNSSVDQNNEAGASSTLATKSEDSGKNNGSVTNKNKTPSFPDWGGNKVPEFRFNATQNKEGISKLQSIFGKPLETSSKEEKTDNEATIQEGDAKQSDTSEQSSKEAKKEVNPLMVNPFTSQLGMKTTTLSGFRASSGSPALMGLSFSSGRSFSSTATSSKADDDDYQPPKVVFTPVQEEGSVYSKRCKVFVKKDSSYQDRGVGMLYLKPVASEGKTQLIVRADTSIGNLLINSLLASSMSPQRMGSNNVMLVCIPTPEAAPPPVPVLLRVKTSDDADELLEKLKEFINKK